MEIDSVAKPGPQINIRGFRFCQTRESQLSTAYAPLYETPGHSVEEKDGVRKNTKVRIFTPPPPMTHEQCCRWVALIEKAGAFPPSEDFAKTV